MNMFRSISGFISSSVNSIAVQSPAGSAVPAPVATSATPVLPRSASAVPRLLLTTPPPSRRSPPPSPTQTTTSTTTTSATTTATAVTDSVTATAILTTSAASSAASTPSSGATSSPDSEPEAPFGDSEPEAPFGDEYDDEDNVEKVVDSADKEEVVADEKPDEEDVAVADEDEEDDDDFDDSKGEVDDDSSDSEYGLRRSPSGSPSPRQEEADVDSKMLPEADERDSDQEVSNNDVIQLNHEDSSEQFPPPNQLNLPPPPPPATDLTPSTASNNSSQPPLISPARQPPAPGKETPTAGAGSDSGHGSSGGTGWNSRRSSTASNASSLAASDPIVPDVDLSHLSEEERAMIAAVMARAKMLEEDVVTASPPPPRPPSVTPDSAAQQGLSLSTAAAAAAAEDRNERPAEAEPIDNGSESTNASRAAVAAGQLPLTGSALKQDFSSPADQSFSERSVPCDVIDDVRRRTEDSPQPSDEPARHEAGDELYDVSCGRTEVDYVTTATSVADVDEKTSVVLLCEQRGIKQTESCSEANSTNEIASALTTTKEDTEIRKDKGEIPFFDEAQTAEKITSSDIISDEHQLAYLSKQFDFDVAAQPSTVCLASDDRAPAVDSSAIRRPLLEDGLSPAVSPSELEGSDNDYDPDGENNAVFQKIYCRPRNLHISRHSSVPGAGRSAITSGSNQTANEPVKRRSSSGSPGSGDLGSFDHASSTSASTTSTGQIRHHQQSHSLHADLCERRRSVPPSTDRSAYYQQQLEGGGCGGTVSGERNQSPSRRSPKSPPRSPSAWMQRLRESPTRATSGQQDRCTSGRNVGGQTNTGGGSPGIKSPTTQLSPSAVERYPSNELNDGPVGIPSSADDSEIGAFSDNFDLTRVNSESVTTLEDNRAGLSGRNSRELFDSGGVVDLASYAASVASGAAHLTHLGDSPPDLVQNDQGLPSAGSTGGHRYANPPTMLTGTVSISASTTVGPSFAAADFLSPDEYITCTTSGAGNQSQPADNHQASASGGGDWALRPDLSPIIDVSPSVERLEQEKMLAEQRQQQETDQQTSDNDMMTSQTLSANTPTDSAGDSKAANLSTAETSPTMFGLMKRCSSFSDIPTLTSQDDPQQPTPSTASGGDAAATGLTDGIFRFDGSMAGFAAGSSSSISGDKKQNLSSTSLSSSIAAVKTFDADKDDVDDVLVGGLQKFDDWFKAAFQELMVHDSKDTLPNSSLQTTNNELPSKSAVSTSGGNVSKPPDATGTLLGEVQRIPSENDRGITMVGSALVDATGVTGSYVEACDDDEDEELIHAPEFLADVVRGDVDEDHEIDLDEDIPPKHVFVATNRIRKQRTLEKQDAIDDVSSSSRDRMLQSASSLPTFDGASRHHQMHSTSSDEFDYTRSSSATSGNKPKPLQSSNSLDETSTSRSSRRKLPVVPEGVDPYVQHPGIGSNSGQRKPPASKLDARQRQFAALISAPKSASADDALYGRKSHSSHAAADTASSTDSSRRYDDGTRQNDDSSLSAARTRSDRSGGSHPTFVRSKSADEPTKRSNWPLYSTHPPDRWDDDEIERDGINIDSSFLRQRSQSLQPQVASDEAPISISKQEAAKLRSASVDVKPSPAYNRPTSKPPPPPTPPRPTPPAIPPKPASLQTQKSLPDKKNVSDIKAALPPTANAHGGNVFSAMQKTPAMIKPEASGAAAGAVELTESSEDGELSPDFSDTPTIIRRPPQPAAVTLGTAGKVETKRRGVPYSVPIGGSTSTAAGAVAKKDIRADKQQPEADVARLLNKPDVPPKPPRIGRKKEQDELPTTRNGTSPEPPATVTICRGLEVPLALHALQQRVKDEIKIVTATTRLRIDEAEEVRMMEAELAERAREREKLHHQQQQQRLDGTATDDKYSTVFSDGGVYGVMAANGLGTDLGYMTNDDETVLASGNGDLDDDSLLSSLAIEREMALAASAAVAANRRSQHGVISSGGEIPYRQRGVSESDMAAFEYRFSPIEEDFGPLDEQMAAMFDNSSVYASSVSGRTSASPRMQSKAVVDNNPTDSMMFNPKSIYLGTSALQVRDRKSPLLAAASEPDPWSTSSPLHERNYLSRSTDLLRSVGGGNPATTSPVPPAGIACRRSASASAMAAELTSNMGDLYDDDDYYRKQCKPVTMTSNYDNGRFYVDLERRSKEEKLLKLQMEIERRRRQLQEMTQMTQLTQSDVQRTGQMRREVGGMVAASWQQKNFGGGGNERYKYQTLPARTQLATPDKSAVRPQPASTPSVGLIKPIDYQIDPQKYYLQQMSSAAAAASVVRHHHQQQQQQQQQQHFQNRCGGAVDFVHGVAPDATGANVVCAGVGGTSLGSSTVYSSFEYLAHRTEFSSSPSSSSLAMHQRQQQQQQQPFHPHQRHQSNSSIMDDFSQTGNVRSSPFMNANATAGVGTVADRFRRDDSSDRIIGGGSGAAEPAVHHQTGYTGYVGGISGGSGSERFTYSTSEDSLAYCSSSAGPTMHHAGSRDSGVSSSLTGGEIYTTTSGLIPSSYGRSGSTSAATIDRNMTSVDRMLASTSPPSNHVFDELYHQERHTTPSNKYRRQQHQTAAQVHATSGSGYEATTPAMPILDDVTSRSRNLLRDIGSRPLSDDVEKYFQAEEPLNLMFCEDSEYSLAAATAVSAASAADSGDENVMEGGVTIRQYHQSGIAGGRQPLRSISNLRCYNFPTKTILLTADPKTARGNGVGVKVIGGQQLPWADNQVGAYVASILPGSAADRLHGELREGDQVLEWNGEILTGKTYEEVRDITSYCNGGEVEIVVRPTMFGLNSNESRSFYDNMEFAGSYQGSTTTTTKSQTDISRTAPPSYAETMSPPPSHVNKTKSPPGDGSFSRNCSPAIGANANGPNRSDSSEFDLKAAAARRRQQQPQQAVAKNGDNSLRRQERPAQQNGEIQLQLSYDDYDGSLNVHVIKARNLTPAYKNGYADPYVKVYLLPYKSSENKGRTKSVSRTLDPEWNRTIVFLHIPRDELSEKGVEFTVWDHDRFMSNQCLGELVLDLADADCIDNQPHWYRLSNDDRSTRFGGRPRVQTMSPSDSSESSTTTRQSSVDSISGLAVSGDGNAGRHAAGRHGRKHGSRFRGDPDGSPVPQQPQSLRGRGETGNVGGGDGSTASPVRRRQYDDVDLAPETLMSPMSSRRGDLDDDDGTGSRDNVLVTDDNDIENEDQQLEELFLKHHHEQQQRASQKGPGPQHTGSGGGNGPSSSPSARGGVITAINSSFNRDVEPYVAGHRVASAVTDSTSSATFFGLLNSIFCCLRPLCGSARQCGCSSRTRLIPR